jgi:hypothetical protein
VSKETTEEQQRLLKIDKLIRLGKYIERGYNQEIPEGYVFVMHVEDRASRVCVLKSDLEEEDE